ncbi:SHOCT domain-containing protein [Hyperthermus butylicus]|uniref:SHOCT domain-containing protein n=1 Tax=Hyperthermus butylicus (strain DSM 5456 / JCM 9403 / PLM1-5) TaxID=415426 RepID=A2BKM7_HYPBU|nr:SHOCT domain-containing protein [Hyperthermus butylicus]ABM80538.1 hypothetical protein Hbut_0682 [Hyperthermus butylicus DSM 5456]
MIVKKKHIITEEWILEKPKEIITRAAIQPQQQQIQTIKSEEDPIEKLEKLKRLLDEGVITREEYEMLRKKILEKLA